MEDRAPRLEGGGARAKPGRGWLPEFEMTYCSAQTIWAYNGHPTFRIRVPGAWTQQDRQCLEALSGGVLGLSGEASSP